MATTMLGLNLQKKELNLKETELCLGLPGTPKSTSSTNNINGKRGYAETVDLKLNLDLDVSSSSSSPTSRLSQESSANLINSPTNKEKGNNNVITADHMAAEAAKLDPVPKPPAKAQVVGWPPVRSYRKNIMATTTTQKSSAGAATTADNKEPMGAAFVKVSIDGAPYLRKVDLKMYKSYQELSDALGKMFSAFTGNYSGGAGSDGMIDFMNESKLMDLLNSSDHVPTYEDKDGDWMLVGDVPWEMFVDSCKRLRIMKGSEAVGLAPRAMEKCKSRS